MTYVRCDFLTRMVVVGYAYTLVRWCAGARATEVTVDPDGLVGMLRVMGVADDVRGLDIGEIRWRIAAMQQLAPARVQDLARALVAAGWVRVISRRGRRWYPPGTEAPHTEAERRRAMIDAVYEAVAGAHGGAMTLGDLVQMLRARFGSDEELAAIKALCQAGRLRWGARPKGPNTDHLRTISVPERADLI